MFKCQKCEQSADRPNKIVVERKMVKHLHTSVPTGPRGGMGPQIVREISVCSSCLAATAEAPLERAPEVQPVVIGVPATVDSN